MKKILFMIIAIIVLTGCSAQMKDQQTMESSTFIYQQEAGDLQLVLQFPEELTQYVIRERSTFGAAVTETFYIKNGDSSIPLFRVDAGDKNLGDWLGVIRTKNGDIPITYTVFEISEEDMKSLGENADVLYADLMNGFNVMLNAIFDDPCFVPDKPLEVGESQNMVMNYWTVNLPDNMWFTENHENGNYEAVFYTSIQGEDVALYTVRVGDVPADTELGVFELDGAKKPISVGSFDLPEMSGWSTDDYSMAYRMMDTINDVIEQIVSSKHFSEFEAE